MDQAKVVYHNPACFDLPEVNELGPSFTLGAEAENGAYSETEPADDAVDAVDHGASSDVEDAADHGASSDAEDAADHGTSSDAEDAADHGGYSEAEPFEAAIENDALDAEHVTDEAQEDPPSPKRLKPTNE